MVEDFGKLIEILKKSNGFIAYIDLEGNVYLANGPFSILYTIPTIDKDLLYRLKDLYGSVFNVPNIHKLYSDGSVKIEKHDAGYLLNNKYMIYDSAHNPHFNRFNMLIQSSLPQGEKRSMKGINELDAYKEYQNINIAYGKFDLNLLGDKFIVYKNFIPTNKNDKIDIDIYNKGEYSTAIFTIYKPKGLVVKCAVNFYNI